MKQIQCNKCGKYFEVEEHEEWGYCPFCKNDQVEVPKRFEQWGYDSFKDNETSEIKSDYIELLNKQNDKIKVLEKALELACVEIPCEDCPLTLNDGECDSTFVGCKIALSNYFKTKAKEMMKNE